MIAPLPPLSVYLHLPWCARKCPYCDFNSHAGGPELPETEYLAALRADMVADAPLAQGRSIQTVFIGGGTPSLFSGAGIAAILDTLASQFSLDPRLEVTLEANPGSADQGRFSDYAAAGVNRLSIGAQSFNDRSLQALGRIHDSEHAVSAVRAARQAGFSRLNVDLMHGLPGQDTSQAMADLDTAIALEPEHVSWYQLTIEPNTVFASRPPVLPVDDTLAEIQDFGHALLDSAGYGRYEVSAFARPGGQCRHNRNYWEFGDYLAFGAGAHGKISFADGRIRRYWKTRMPADYMRTDATHTAGERWLDSSELPFEFMMNALRLVEGVPAELFRVRTGLDIDCAQRQIDAVRGRGLLEALPGRLAPSALGLRFLNDLLAEFL